MLYRFLLLLTSLVAFAAHAQTIDTARVFSHTHGIRQGGNLFYEVEGYSVFMHVHKATFDEKGFRKIKKTYGIDKGLIPQEDPAFPGSRVLMTYQRRTDKVTESDVYYLFPEGTNGVKVISLRTLQRREAELERFFVQSILANSIPESVYSSAVVDSIPFAGRTIQLGPACRWMSPHNVQCPDMGQMNWAEYSSMEKAQQMIDDQFDITSNKRLGEVLQQDTVDIVFEGTPAKAMKVKYRILIPQLIMAGSNILIIYYVAAPVRDRYVACVLSHYTDDMHANTLPPLLSEVMEVKENRE
jgi:hypothetical protein